jgi:hypothetical protein
MNIYWKDLEIIERHRELIHAPLGAYGSRSEALTAHRTKSSLRLSLDGVWKFHLTHSPKKYGLYVVDETNRETHGIGSQLSRDPAWANQYLSRLVRMVLRDRNYPSIIAWSLGNESHCGPHHAAMAAWARYFDPTRIVQSSRSISYRPERTDLPSASPYCQREMPHWRARTGLPGSKRATDLPVHQSLPEHSKFISS